jgi:hypothetical protein
VSGHSKDGYLPILRYQYRDGGVTYNVAAFSAALRSDAAGRNPVN